MDGTDSEHHGAIPGLELVRGVFNHGAAAGKNQNHIVAVVDVRRACFYAELLPKTFVELSDYRDLNSRTRCCWSHPRYRIITFIQLVCRCLLDSPVCAFFLKKIRAEHRMEQILADLLIEAEVTPDTLYILEQADVLTVQDFVDVSSSDLLDLDLSGEEFSKIIWVQVFAIFDLTNHLSGLRKRLLNLGKTLDEVSDGQAQELIKSLGVSVGKRSKVRTAIASRKAKMLEVKHSVKGAQLSETQEVVAVKTAKVDTEGDRLVPGTKDSADTFVVNVALHEKPQPVKEERGLLPDTKNLSGNEAVDVALLEEVQLAEQSMNTVAVNVALRRECRSS